MANRSICALARPQFLKSTVGKQEENHQSLEFLSQRSESMKPDKRKHGQLIKKAGISGPGLILQGLGVAAIVAGGPLGSWRVTPSATAIGLTLILFGSLVSLKYTCSECGNRIREKTTSICPTCRSPVSGVRSPEYQWNIALAVAFIIITAALASIVVKVVLGQ